VTDALVIAIVGAESTGKTALARELSDHLRTQQALRAAWIPEALRDWCAARGRTPLRHEQAAIADEQTARIDRAARDHDVVVADTTALMTAVYSHIVFGDGSLDALAATAHRRCTLTLLTAIDLPWQADGLQRDGPQVREPVDTRLRQLMDIHGIGFSLVCGQGPRRLASALQALSPWLGVADNTCLDDTAARPTARWRSRCERCGDPACEHALLVRGWR
jgi:nicotinamide riboside kinase